MFFYSGLQFYPIPLLPIRQNMCPTLSKRRWFVCIVKTVLSRKRVPSVPFITHYVHRFMAVGLKVIDKGNVHTYVPVVNLALAWLAPTLLWIQFFLLMLSFRGILCDGWHVEVVNIRGMFTRNDPVSGNECVKFLLMWRRYDKWKWNE